jgi:hypothetical protein
MTRMNRRTVLKLFGTAALAGSVGTVYAQPKRGPPKKGRIRKMGHSLLSDPVGEYAEGVIREDGMYGLAGSFFGTGGSFLVDLRNPTQPTQVHRVPSSENTRNADVKFDPRDGLYYRSQEPNNEQGEGGVEIIDYGFSVETPKTPEIIADLPAGPTHNVFPHPDVPILYAVNEHGIEGQLGMDVFDVSDPFNPVAFGDAGPNGAMHDVVVDPERDLAHCAYIGEELDGYVILDTSDPASPTEIGRFDYDTADDEYSFVGDEAFENCHYATYDPERELAVVGDETASGVPGGKHIFDIGYDEGSPQNPIPLGFTLSPNAELMNEEFEAFDWTTHNHSVIPKGDTTLLVGGDYHEGTVVYDITDPRDPTPTDQYRTDDDADEVSDIIFPLGSPPMAWSADYSAERDLVFTSDMITGVYTFKVTPSAASTRGRRH